MNAVIDRFLEALWIEDGLAANTLAAYRRDLAAYAVWLESEQGLRVVSDYIAGMTDRFAGSEFARLTGQVAFAAD